MNHLTTSRFWRRYRTLPPAAQERAFETNPPEASASKAPTNEHER